MRISSPKLDTSHLTANEEAILRCQTALELKDKGRYESARAALGDLWPRMGDRPKLEGLYPSVAAEVLLCVGILTRWIGSREQLTGLQEVARDLIGESISFYESVHDVKKIAAARAELAYCYWWQGSLDEARIMFNEALIKLTLEGNTRATAVLGLAVVEWSASRYNEGIQILSDNATLFEKISNQATKGAYHSQLGMLFRTIGTSQNKRECFQRAIAEYQAADRHFKLAQNHLFRADVKNNLGFLLYKLAKVSEAHKYVAEARRLAVSARDKVRVAQFDETRAQVFIAEKKYKEAETTAKGAVRVLERSGHQCLLADALVTYAIALARLKQTERAKFTFQKAIDVAHQVGALNKAGLAALTMIEELDDLSPEDAFAAYDRANEWLSKSQTPDLLARLNVAARRVVAKLHAELAPEETESTPEEQPADLHSRVLKFEESLIRQALAKSSGSVTRAAALLDMSYQGLAYVIASRHRDLLKERSPVRRRARKDRERQKKE